MDCARSYMERIIFDIKKVKAVDIKKVVPNTWNPKKKDQYQKVKKSIEDKGQRLPVIVRTKGKEFEIVDGEQRWRSAVDLGYKKILIYDEGKMSDKEAKELTIYYQQQVPFYTIELAEFIVKNPDLQLPYSSEELLDLRNMVTIDWEAYGDGEIDFGKDDNSLKKVFVNDEDFEKIKEMAKAFEPEKEKKNGISVIRTYRRFILKGERLQRFDRLFIKIKEKYKLEDVNEIMNKIIELAFYEASGNGKGNV
jgi:hypothetical protein